MKKKKNQNQNCSHALKGLNVHALQPSQVVLLVQNQPAQAGDQGSVPGWGRSPGEGNGYPLQYSWPGESHGQRSLVSYSVGDRKESDTTIVTNTATTPCTALTPLSLMYNATSGLPLPDEKGSHPASSPVTSTSCNPFGLQPNRFPFPSLPEKQDLSPCGNQGHFSVLPLQSLFPAGLVDSLCS